MADHGIHPSPEPAAKWRCRPIGGGELRILVAACAILHDQYSARIAPEHFTV